MRIELINEEKKTIVLCGVLLDPTRRRCHRPGAREVFLRTKVAARVVVGHPCAAETLGGPNPARVGTRPPRIGLVTALVIPGGEIGVIVLAAGFKQMGVVADQHRSNAGPTQ